MLVWVLLLAGLLCGGASLGGPVLEPLAEIPRELLADRLFRPTIFNRSEKFQLPPLELLRVGSSQGRVLIPGLNTVQVADRPELPLWVRSFHLPKGTSARVFLENLEVERTQTEVPLDRIAQPYEWTEGSTGIIGESASGQYFPGKFLDYRESNGVGYVTVFPVQWDRRSGHLIVLRSAQLLVNYYDLNTLSVEGSIPDFQQVEALILTPLQFMEEARQLADFYKYVLGVRNEVVSIETIARLQSPLPESDLPPGYKEGRMDSVVIPYDPETGEGYNYRLARQIMQFLKGRKHRLSRAKYVTLLGDAHHIPPSYYFNAKIGSRDKIGVTDQCYGSRRQCTEPWLAVGRLPFSTREEFIRYLGKLSHWVRTSKRVSSELSLFGGKAFPLAPVYVGELSALRPLQVLGSNWLGVKKFFRTKGNFNRHALLDALRGSTQSLFVYYADHGEGNYLRVGKDRITSNEILALSAQPETLLPIFVSVSCNNALFDNMLLRESVFKNEAFGSEPVGAAMLKADAGAVAYLGSTRRSIGGPVYTIDGQGNLDLNGSTYFLHFLEMVLDNYRREKEGRLGDFVLEAMREYVFRSGYDPQQPKHRWTYLGFQLLGDPLLPLPERQEGESFPMARALSPFMLARHEFPTLLNQLLDTFVIEYESTASVRTAVYKITPATFLNPFGEERLFSQLTQGLSQLEIDPAVSGYGPYLVRVENQQGVPVERRVWFEVVD